MENPSSRTDVEQVPHSGNLPDELRETPVRNFDKTPLNEAVDQGYIQTPIDAQPLTQEVAKKSKKGLWMSLGGGATAILLAGGLALGAPNDGESNLPPEGEPVATAPVNPTGEASPNSPETIDDLYSSFEIKDSTPPEQLGPEFVDLIGKWAMFGTADPNFENKLYASIANGEVATAGEYAAKLAKEESVKIADEIFVANWETDEQIKQAVTIFEQNQTATVEMFSKTFNSGQSEDVEPFTYSTTTETSSIISQNEDLSEVTSKTVLVEHVNTDRNRATQLNPNIGNINGHKATITATFVKVDGTYKISKLDIKG